MFFSVRVAKGWPVDDDVGEDMSTTQRCRLDSVPELVAWAAEAGRIMCWFAWLLMLTEVLWEKDMRRRAACAMDVGGKSSFGGKDPTVFACSDEGESSYGVLIKLEEPETSDV